MKVVTNRPSAPVFPEDAPKDPPVRTTSTSFTAKSALSTTVTITVAVPPRAMEFEEGTTDTARGPFGITWRPAKDQKLSIPPGTPTQPSNRPIRYGNETL